MNPKPRVPWQPLGDRLERIRLEWSSNDDPWALESALPATLVQLAEASGIVLRQLSRFVAGGVPVEYCDRLATAAGTHQDILWPELLEQAIADVERADAEALEARRKRKAAAMRRHRARLTPEQRAREAADAAAYRSTARRAIGVYRRAYYAEHRDDEIAAARARRERAS